MKKTIMMLLAVGALAVVTTGCNSFETNRVGEQIDVKMELPVNPEVEAGKEMIAGKAKVHCLFGIFTWGVSKQAVGINYFNGYQGTSFFTSPADVARNGAAYNACVDANADLLLAPRYELDINDFFVYKSIDCKVKAFPGFLKAVTIKK